MTSDFDAFAYLAWAQLWQVTIVALAVGAIVRLCGRQRPRLAYALWMLVVVKSIVPPAGAARQAFSVGRLLSRRPNHRLSPNSRPIVSSTCVRHRF